MERRLLLFVTLSVLVIVANGLWINKQQAERREAAAKAAAAAGKDGKVEGDKPAEAAAAKDDGVEKAADGEKAEDGDEAAPAAAQAADAEPETPLEYVTLGSVDPSSDYRMLVTLTNAGAGVRRVELASPRFLDLHDRGGYLGSLELSADTEPGLLVRAVGAGTPAAKAGVQVGDRLLEAGVKKPEPLKKPADLAKVLAAARPRNKMTLVVGRAGGKQTLTVELVRRPLEVIRPESENVLLRNKALPAGFIEPPSMLLTLAEVGDLKLNADADELAGLDLRKGHWRIVARDESSVTFERRAGELGLTVTKRYELAKATKAAPTADRNSPLYHLTLEITIANAAADAGGEARRLAYQLDGPNGLPIEGWWYATKIGREWSAAGIRDVVGRYFGSKPQQLGASKIAAGKAEGFEGGQAMAYMGVDAQYFCVALLPLGQDLKKPWIATAKPIVVGPKPNSRTDDLRLTNVSARLTSEPNSIAPGGKLTHKYEVFVGPKRPDLLAKYEANNEPAYTLRDFVYYGWFGGVAQFMVGILHVFYGWVGNYGVAIIMLTVLVRGLMFPVSRGQARSMAKMQELRPEMERLKERYKGDQQKYAQAMRQLYSKNNVNPLGGCLPALIQFPIFIGLWRGLAVDIELRQAPLFGQAVKWCSNLAAPDQFWDWSGIMPDVVNRGEGFFGFGPYLNLLPLVTIGLFLWQQKMFMPPPANEQAELQQKIMKYMMIVVSIMFYKVPSGLCLYLIASSLWGIGERKLFPPPTAANAEGGGAGASGGTARSPSGGVGGDKRSAKNGQARDKRAAKAKRKR